MENFTVVYNERTRTHFFYMNLDGDKLGDLSPFSGHICISNRADILSKQGVLIVSPDSKDYDVYIGFIVDAIVAKKKILLETVESFTNMYPRLTDGIKSLEDQLQIIENYKNKIPKKYFDALV